MFSTLGRQVKSLEFESLSRWLVILFTIKETVNMRKFKIWKTQLIDQNLSTLVSKKICIHESYLETRFLLFSFTWLELTRLGLSWVNYTTFRKFKHYLRY